MKNVQCDECLDDAAYYDSMTDLCRFIQIMEMLNMTYREMKNALLNDIFSIELACDKCDGVTIYDKNIYDFTFIFDAINDFKDDQFKKDEQVKILNDIIKMINYKDNKTCL